MPLAGSGVAWRMQLPQSAISAGRLGESVWFAVALDLFRRI